MQISKEEKRNSELKKHLLLVLIVVSLFTFTGLGATSFLDPDEGVYGEIAREMAESGDWITPRFNGVRYFYKPPLFFWLASFTIWVLGPSEWAVRLWSAVPAFGTALLVWRLGALIYGQPAGFLAALVMVSGVGVLRYVRVAATDFLLVFSITLAVYGFVKCMLSPSGSSSRLGPLVFWFGMALGILSKGLIGLILPLLIVGLFILANRGFAVQMAGGSSRFQAFGAVCSLPALLVFLASVLPWHLWAAWSNEGFLGFYVVDNQFLRFLNRRAFGEGDIPVGVVPFLLLTLVGFFPWSLFLPASLRYGFPRLSPGSLFQEQLRLVVGLWAVVVLGFFFLSSSRLEHYFLPSIPALSLMVGALWADFVSGRSSVVDRWFRRCFWAGSLSCFVLGLALLLFSDFLTPELFLAGLGELNVYYRILHEQGAALPFESLTPFVEVLRVLGAALSIGLPAACFFLSSGFTA